MKIHKEGFKLIPLAALVLGLLYALLYWLIPFLIVQVILGIAAIVMFVLVVRFFRDPEVRIELDNNQIIAPAGRESRGNRRDHRAGVPQRQTDSGVHLYVPTECPCESQPDRRTDFLLQVPPRANFWWPGIPNPVRTMKEPLSGSNTHQVWRS